MKLPRDLSAADLEKAHRRLTTHTGGEHHLTIPNHAPLRTGTLRAILGEVMAHHRLTLEQVLKQLGIA